VILLPFTVSGAIIPILPDKTVILTYKKPDGSTYNRTATTLSDGNYSDSYKPDSIGSWTVIALWDGDLIHNGASSSQNSFTVKEKPFTETPLGIATISGVMIVAVIITIAILKKRTG